MDHVLSILWVRRKICQIYQQIFFMYKLGHALLPISVSWHVTPPESNDWIVSVLNIRPPLYTSRLSGLALFFGESTSSIVSSHSLTRLPIWTWSCCQWVSWQQCITSSHFHSFTLCHTIRRLVFNLWFPLGIWLLHLLLALDRVPYKKNWILTLTGNNLLHRAGAI